MAVILVEDAVRARWHLGLQDVCGVRTTVRVRPLPVESCDEELRLVPGQRRTTVVGDALVAVPQCLLKSLRQNLFTQGFI